MQGRGDQPPGINSQLSLEHKSVLIFVILHQTTAVKIKQITVLLTLLIFFGCKKNGSTNTPVGTMLSSVTTKNDGNTDSTKILFSYDANNKFIHGTGLWNFSGFTGSYNSYLTRNSLGFINRITVVGGVTNIYIVTNDGSDHYVSRITDVPLATRDSVAFSYTGSNVTHISDYTYNQFGDGVYDLVGEGFNTYDGNGNIITQETIFYSNVGIIDYHSITTYTYDSRINALRLNDDSFNTGLYGYIGSSYPYFTGANNVVSESYVDLINSANNHTYTYSYTYNSNNMPASAIETMQPSGDMYTKIYTYQ